MREISRVLKPGGWATVVFHNTDAEVWQAIRNAADSAGFDFHEAASLDRRQQSHKGYKGRSGSEDVAHFDVVFNLRKPERPVRKVRSNGKGEFDLAASLRRCPRSRDRRRGLQGVHAEVMRRLASEGEFRLHRLRDIRDTVGGVSEASPRGVSRTAQQITEARRRIRIGRAEGHRADAVRQGYGGWFRALRARPLEEHELGAWVDDEGRP